MISRLLLLFVAYIAPFGKMAEEPPCQAHLELHQQAQLLTLTGYCHSLLDQAAHYRYRLIVSRNGAAGHSQNSQSGTFSLDARQAATLSTVQLNVSPLDGYQARLLVYDASGTLVAQDSAGRASHPR